MSIFDWKSLSAVSSVAKLSHDKLKHIGHGGARFLAKALAQCGRRGLSMTRQLLYSLLVIVSFVVMVTSGKTANVQRITSGPWGGPGIHIEVTEKSAKVEFDCAHGTIQGPLNLDSKGEFKLKGSFTRERGGPVRSDQNESSEPAVYTGSIKGETMTLELKLDGQDQALNSYVLTQGKTGRLHKCM